MSFDFNKVILVGRLVKDPELIELNTDTSICKFSLAVNGYSNDNEENVSFIDMTAFNNIGKNIYRYLNKGSKVLVEGRLNQDKWVKEDKKYSKLNVIVNNILFLDKKNNTSATDGDSEVKKEVPFPF